MTIFHRRRHPGVAEVHGEFVTEVAEVQQQVNDVIRRLERFSRDLSGKVALWKLVADDAARRVRGGDDDDSQRPS